MRRPRTLACWRSAGRESGEKRRLEGIAGRTKARLRSRKRTRESAGAPFAYACGRRRGGGAGEGGSGGRESGRGDVEGEGGRKEEDREDTGEITGASRAGAGGERRDAVGEGAWEARWKVPGDPLRPWRNVTAQPAAQASSRRPGLFPASSSLLFPRRRPRRAHLF